MNTSELMIKLSKMEQEIIKEKTLINFLKKRERLSFIKELKTELSYRIPKSPINISNDGLSFRCPTCNTLFDSDGDNYSEYDVCYICGQIWKSDNTLRQRLDTMRR